MCVCVCPRARPCVYVRAYVCVNMRVCVLACVRMRGMCVCMNRSAIKSCVKHLFLTHHVYKFLFQSKGVP